MIVSEFLDEPEAHSMNLRCSKLEREVIAGRLNEWRGTMPLTIRLETEDGNCVAELDDVHSLLIRRINALSRERQHLELARFIDPYGDTVFNKLQLPPFIRDLELICAKENDAEERSLLSEIGVLAARGAHESGLYLKFVGD